MPSRKGLLRRLGNIKDAYAIGGLTYWLIKFKWKDIVPLFKGRYPSTYGAYSVWFKGVTSSGDIVSGYKSRFRDPD